MRCLALLCAWLLVGAGARMAGAAIGNSGGDHVADDFVGWVGIHAPGARFGSARPFTVFMWLWQDASDRDAGERNTIFDADGVCRVEMDYGTEELTAQVETAGGPVITAITDFTDDGTETGTLPTGAWVLVALSWEEPADGASPGTLTLRARSDAVAGAGGTGISGFRAAVNAGSPGATLNALGVTTGVRYGAVTGRHWTGIRIIFIRDHAITDDDFGDVWAARSPTAPYQLDTTGSGGTMNGPAGHVFCGGVFHPADPKNGGVASVAGMLPGDLVTTSNLTSVNEQVSDSLIHVRPAVVGAASSFHAVDVFDASAPWGGFFIPILDTSAGGGANVSGVIGANTRTLVQATYDDVVRTISWSNSRGVRLSSMLGRTYPEQHSHGFTAARPANQCGGLNYPVHLNTVTLFGQDQSTSSGFWRTGTVQKTWGGSELGRLRSFQRLWSGGGTFAASQGALGSGGGVLLMPGAQLQITFQPVPGSLLTHTGDATMELYTFQHGAGAEMTATPVKTSAITLAGTTTASPVVTAGPAITLSRTIGPADSVDSLTQITFDGDLAGAVVPGQIALIASAVPLDNAINMVESVTGSNPTVVTFARAWPDLPVDGDVLEFATTQVEAQTHALPALDAVDSETRRGVLLANTGTGVLVVHANSFWMNGVAGEMHGPAGWSGSGYPTQFAGAFPGALERMFELVAPDVVFAFPADQGAVPTDWANAVAIVNTGAPDAEVVLTAPADMSTVAWDQYATDDANTSALGVTGVRIRDSDRLGNKTEMIGRFHLANVGHWSARGNVAQAEVILERLNAAIPPCPADLDGSGDVGFSDILAVIAAWGVCAECPEDLDGSGDVGFGDVLALIAVWGAC